MKKEEGLKKCIVLDLDNTLWGGVVGEDGQNNLALSMTEPGSGFLAFQQTLMDLFHNGVILAINSRNNPNDALSVIRTHPNMILRESNFAAMRINWNDKVDNMKELAKELNIGLDSIVYLDDDPVNRAAVRQFLPEVTTPELPGDSKDYAQFLLSLPYFPRSAITDEDKMRGNLYVTERLRMKAEKNFSTKDDFLKSLGLQLEIYINDKTAFARLSQLSEKTNQFNTNKRPLTQKDLEKMLDDPSRQILHGRVLDRFGDYGIVVSVLIHKKKGEWSIENFLMSCRVIGRGVEDAVLMTIAELAKKEKVFRLTISFKKTEKNKPADEFVSKYFKKGILDEELTPKTSWVKITHGNF